MRQDIHAPDRFRNRNPSKRSAADPRLWLLGHWDRLLSRTFPLKPSPTVTQLINRSHAPCVYCNCKVSTHSMCQPSNHSHFESIIFDNVP
jgi:hypothetical protein